ncbi:MAG: RNA polymerase factor sigma-54 [Bacteroidaceae bacterium]|nr:RNA polymerase factor sigma-54 [Bacteroidaceae bacterium]
MLKQTQTQTQTQGQSQSQSQSQKLTTQQVQFMHMLEMPIDQLEHEVAGEINDNPALVVDDVEVSQQKGGEDETIPAVHFSSDSSDADEDNDSKSEDTDSSYSTDGGVLDDFDDGYDRRVVIEQTHNEGETLYQRLLEQVNMLDLDDREKMLMEHLMGLLDNDGLLKKQPIAIAEELMLFQGVETDVEEVQRLIDLFKTMDPAGIGAQSLQECLLIQVDRRRKSAVTAVMKRILRDYFNEFIHENWKYIYRKINEDEELVRVAIEEIRRLNPRPGAGLGEDINVAAQQIVPDFIVETDEGQVKFYVNYGKIPALAVAEDFDDLVKKYEGLDREKIRKKEYDAFVYARNRVRRANAYIQLLQMRFRTMYVTMKHIVARQKTFFLTGDDNDLKPLLLKDIAAEVGYDISTISRTCNGKYVETEWGIYPMKHFFLLSYSSASNGEEQYTLQQIYSALKEIIDGEDKQKPLSDDKITQMMKEKGFSLARRTVAKHREKLGIKVARLRKR